MDGLTATKSITSIFPEARVVVMTSLCDHEMQQEARSAGAVQFIQKENILALKQIIGKR
jgi:DNA-binding NarL/FixJ family response regulator